MSKSLESLEKDIMKTMLYFDIFNYPLRADEVFSFLQRNSVTREHVSNMLEKLASKKVLFQFDQLFSVSSSEENVIRRLKGNQFASSITPFAKQRAAFIASFPFVRAVMGSGSFSKNYMDEKSDLDFFVITAPGSVWIPRTLLAMYKRLFLKNSHQYFCTNYFLEERHLQINERNLFTATELATLVPLYNGAAYKKLIEENDWVREFFPNFKPRTYEVKSEKSQAFRTMTECIMWPFKWIAEPFLHWVHATRLRSVYGKSYSEDDYKIAFKAAKHVSKVHPRNFQTLVMKRYHEKLHDHHLHQS